MGLGIEIGVIHGSRGFEEAGGYVHDGTCVVVDAFPFQVLLVPFVLRII